jgi:hypothetical protein
MLLTAVVASVVTRTSASPIRNSGPSFLTLVSSDTRLNGTILAACHEGAAIDALCTTSLTTADPPVLRTTFHFKPSSNVTRYSDINISGQIAYEMSLGGNQTIESTLRLTYSPWTNVALPIFMPGPSGDYGFYFDECDKLYIARGYDDTVPPENSQPQRPDIKDYNWYVCLTWYGYLYETLAWTVGVAEPQNPTCQKVDVQRVYI